MQQKNQFNPVSLFKEGRKARREKQKRWKGEKGPRREGRRRKGRGGNELPA